MLGVTLIVLLVTWFNYFFQGSVARWFKDSFIQDIGRITDNGPQSSELFFNWVYFKDFVLTLFACIIILWLVSTYLIVGYYEKKREQQLIELMAQKLSRSIEGIEDNHPPLPAIDGLLEGQKAKLSEEQTNQIRLTEQEQQQKNELITYLAHDLKTPLATIIGYLTLIEGRSDLTQEQRATYLRITLDKADHLEELVNDFIHVSRFNQQTIQLNKTPIDLFLLLKQLQSDCYPLAKAQEKIIHLQDNAQTEQLIEIDGAEIARVFSNILKNAMAYSVPNSEILIQLSEDPEDLRVTISNQGPAIPTEIQATIFEKFYRADTARSTKTGGAGLGLAIAKQIVDLHQGKISVDSSDTLTTFEVLLPKITK